jgi:hypothetical protein
MQVCCRSKRYKIGCDSTKFLYSNTEYCNTWKNRSILYTNFGVCTGYNKPTIIRADNNKSHIIYAISNLIIVSNETLAETGEKKAKSHIAHS